MAMVNDQNTDEELEIELVDVPEHNDEVRYGLCWDRACPDREDRNIMHRIHEDVREGIITADDATRIYKGGIA